MESSPIRWCITCGAPLEEGHAEAIEACGLEPTCIKCREQRVRARTQTPVWTGPIKKQKADGSASSSQSAMDWFDAVLSAVKRHAEKHGARFTRQALWDGELHQSVSDTGTPRDDPAQGVSLYLQKLRDTGWVKFLGPGRYLFVD